MAFSQLPAAWQHIRFCTPLTEFPIQLASVQRPGAIAGAASNNTDLLDGLQPPQQSGSYLWAARICYWSPKELQELHKSGVPPTLVYRFGGMPGPTDQRTWQTLMLLLQHKDQHTRGSAQGGATARHQQAAEPACVPDGQFSNVLLLHVAGRHNDLSIKMLLVPTVNPEAPSTAKSSERVMLWAYFMVLSSFTVEQRLLMEQQQHMAPLTKDVVVRALSKQRRTQEKVWQSCIDYEAHNQLQENGLPVWMTNVALRSHISQTASHGLLDLVDRCFIAKCDDDRATAAAADSRSEDACACGYAAAGADNLQLAPLRTGPSAEFEQPCDCPENWWCGNAPRRRQLMRLWHGEQLPQLEIKRSAGGKGFGLYAGEDISAGTIIGEYCGEVITLQEMCKREELYDKYGLYYIWQEAGVKNVPPAVLIELQYASLRKSSNAGSSKKRQEDDRPSARSLAIDATWVGGVMRFANHSCDPNCRAVNVCNGKGTQSLDGSPLLLVLMEAIHDISKGDEITFDYQPMDSKIQEKLIKQGVLGSSGGRGGSRQRNQAGQGVQKLTGKVPCECGAEYCRGFLFWQLARQ